MSTHKLLYLFEKSQKISFKEQRFIFDGPESGTRRPPEAEAHSTPPSPEKRDAVEKNSRLNIAILEDTISEPLLQEDYQLNEDLKNLDQDKFDKIVEERLGEIKAGYPKTELNSQQLGTLIEFAKKDEDNMETLFDEFKDKHIAIERLNPESVAAFINYAKDDKEDLEIVINPFINKLLASVIVTASESDPTILKTVYEKMKSDSSILKSLNSKALNVLGNNLDDTDFQDFISKLDDSAKSILLTTEIKPARETIILDDFLKRGFNTLDAAVLEKIIVYVCQKKGDMIYEPSFFDQLNGVSPASQETAKKLTPAAAKVLIEKIYERYERKDSTAASYFRNITKNLPLESRKALIDDKTLKIDIRKALHDSLSDTEKRGIPVPVEEAKAVEPAKDKAAPKAGEAKAVEPAKDKAAPKAGEAKPEPKFETFKENITDKEMLAKAGIELIEKGRGKVQWTFTAKDIGGNKESQRFFVATPEFRGQLTAKIDGKLVNNTAEKVKLVTYQWLLDKVYDKGNVKAAIGNVEEFEKSQAFLRKQIDELTKIVEEQNKAAGTVAPGRPAVTDRAPQKPGDTAVAPTDNKTAPAVDKAGETKGASPTPGTGKVETAKTKMYSNPDRTYITKLPEDGKWYPAKDVTDGKDPNIGKYPDIQYMAEKGELYAKHSVAGKEVMSKWNKEAKKWEPKQPEAKTATTDSTVTPEKAPEAALKFATIEGGEVKPKVSTEWEKKPAEIKTYANPTLIDGKVYQIKPSTLYYTNGPTGTPITSTDKVTLVTNSVREVEGKKYVEIGIDTGKAGEKMTEGWIPLEQLIIPEEDKITVKPGESSSGETMPDSFKKEGTFAITSEMHGSELLDAIFAQPPSIKTKLAESGVSNADYLKLITKYRQGDKLPIIVPEKQMSAIMAEYERRATNTEYQQKDTEAKTRLYENRANYLEEPRFLKDKGLIEAINDDEKWNDLLQNRNGYENANIDGLEKVIHIMGKFGVTPEKVRGELKDVLQIGYNEKITFEEIFDQYCKEKIYINNVDEDGDKEGSFSQFKEELEGLEKDLKPWQTAEGKAKLEKINKYKAISGRLKTLKDSGGDIHSSDEYSEWEQLGKETSPYRNIPEKIARLQSLKDNILFPISEMLDSLSTMNIKVSKEQTFLDKAETLLVNLPTTAEALAKADTYYNMESLVRGGDVGTGLAEYKDAKTLSLVSITAKVQGKFTQLLKDLKLDETKFSSEETLRLIFLAYSPETLAAEKCLQKSPDSTNKFVLTDLPANFNKDNPQVVKLLTEVQAGANISAKNELIRKISETLDKNKAVVKRLMEVFSKDQGPKTYNMIPVDLLGITYLIRALDGKDRRELDLTMSDIGEGKDSLMPDDFLNKYLSDRAAFSEILSKVSTVKDGANVYDESSLKTEFKRRAIHGLSFAIINSKNNPKIYQELTTRYGDLKNPEIFLAAKARLESQIDRTETPLPPDTRELIRIGHVMDGVVEESKEKADLYSQDPDIRKVQEALVQSGKVTSHTDLKKVETALAGGLLISVNGDAGAAVFGAPIDLGGGWKLGVGISATESGVGVGVGVSKGLELTKDGRTVLNFAVTGGALHIGGAVNLQFPLSEEVNANIGAAAGVSAIGFYALGCIGVSKDLNAASIAALREEVKNQGYGTIDKMVKAGKSDQEIAEALVKLPGNGAQFQKLRDEKMPDSGLVEYYNKIKESIDNKTTTETNNEGKITGGGAFAGVINGVPVFGAYLSAAIADRTMIVRRVVPGAPEFSDAQVQAALEKQLGRKVELMKTEAGASGDIVYDANSKQMAVLDKEGSSELDLSKFDSFSGFKTALEKAHMGLSKEKDGSLHLQITNPGEVPANVKVIADPKLKELGIVVTVVDNKIIFKGLSETEMNQFIITRENFHYPFNEKGANKLSIVTIKANPARTRAQIEQESPNIIYQISGHKPDVLRGIGEGKGTSVIVDNNTYTETKIDPKETLENRDAQDFKSYREAKNQALNVISAKEFGEVKDEKILFKFADTFYAKNKIKFRELTTQRSKGNDTYNPQALADLIQAAANKDQTIGRNLNSAELNQAIIHMIGKTFMDARNKPEILRGNLDFCKKNVLKPFFTKAMDSLYADKSGEEKSKLVENMLKRIDDDMMKAANQLDSTEYEKFAVGTFFLSSVGTMGIKGLRGTPYYSSTLDKDYGIINFNKYNPNTPGIEGDIGKALLWIASPLDTSTDQTLMKSPIAIKLAAMDTMYLLLGAEDAKKLVTCFKDGKVDDANKAAFEKFKNIVLKVREAENNDRNYVELENGYEIHIKAKLGMGNYKKCTNPTIAVNEEFIVYGPVNTGIAIENDTKLTVNTSARKKPIEMIFGIKVELPTSETPPPPPQEEDEPSFGDGGSVDEGAGDAPGQPKPAPGASGSVGEGAGGNSNGGAGATGQGDSVQGASE